MHFQTEKQLRERAAELLRTFNGDSPSDAAKILAEALWMLETAAHLNDLRITESLMQSVCSASELKKVGYSYAGAPLSGLIDLRENEC